MGIARYVQTHGRDLQLDCEYCFFLSKDELYPGQRFPDDAEVHEAAQRGNPEVVFAFQGGEPTMMGLKFFRTPLELQQEYVEPGQGVLSRRSSP